METTEEQFLATYYMSQDMVRELASRGMLGSHAMGHRPLALMPRADIHAEMAESKQILEDITGREIDAVSYPFGTPDAVNRTVAECAAEAGYSVGYTMESAINCDVADPLLYARIDAVDVPRIPSLPPRGRYLSGGPATT